MITLHTDKQLIAEMKKLKRLQARKKAEGISEIKDSLLDALSSQLKILANEKDMTYGLIKKLNTRLEEAEGKKQPAIS